MKRTSVGAAVLVCLVVSSCKKNPVDRLTNPLPDGVVPQSSGTYVIYDDELKTGGGLGFIPGSGNQEITLADRSDPRRSDRQIYYVWNGGDVAGQHLFAGFSLLVTPDFSTLSSATGKDLSAAGYTKLTMWIHGTLGANNTLRIEGPTNGATSATPARTELTSSQLSSTDWQQVTLNIPTTSDFSDVKVFATISIQYDQAPRTTNNGEGGAIFIDDIRYER